MMTWRDLGIGSSLNCLPLVLLTTASGVSSSSSPSAASMLGADDHAQAEVDGVLQEDAREALGHDDQLMPLQARHGLLARGAAAEVLPADQDAAGRNLLRLELAR